MDQRAGGSSNAVRGRFPIFTAEAGYSTQILRPLMNNGQMSRLAGFIQTRGVRRCLANPRSLCQ
jgi:hypothetical protein